MTKKPIATKTADTPPSRPMNKDKRLAFFQKLSEHIQEPVTELNYSSNFELLIAVMLSAQATDKSVNLATDKLFKVANTPPSDTGFGTGRIKGLYQQHWAIQLKSRQCHQNLPRIA